MILTVETERASESEQ